MDQNYMSYYEENFYKIKNPFKKIGKDINKAVIKPVDKAVIKPVDKAVIKPIEKEVIKPIGEGVVDVTEDIDKGFKNEIIKPTNKAFDKIDKGFKQLGDVLSDPFKDIWSILLSVGTICCALILVAILYKLAMTLL